MGAAIILGLHSPLHCERETLLAPPLPTHHHCPPRNPEASEKTDMQCVIATSQGWEERAEQEKNTQGIKETSVKAQ